MSGVTKKHGINSIYLFTTIIMLLIGQLSFGQKNEDAHTLFKDSESFLFLPDGIIKSEIALFSLKTQFSSGNFQKARLNEISLKKCSNSYLFFEKGNIWASEITVSIESENIALKSQIKEVLLMQYKFGLFLPDSAIKDIYDPIFCLCCTKKERPIASDCRVFQSEDRRRIYIYMLNGYDNNRYEVTWVIQDSKYYTRIIDFL
jgi:hypothetical protein